MAPLRSRLRGDILHLPGARRARVMIPRLMRRSSALRAIVRRIYALDGSRQAPADVAAGSLLVGVGTETLPVVLVVILGAEPKTVEGAVDEVARLQVITAGFRPVIVTDKPVFESARKYNYPLELLIPAREWSDPRWSWEEYARRVIGIIFEGYRATASVTAGEQGLGKVARVVLSSLRGEPPDAVARAS